MRLARTLDLVTAYTASGLRAGAGLRVGALGPRPERPLELYEFEACPFCRRVREALSMLDLEVYIYPCPKRGTRFRPQVPERGGIEMFPYFVDPNTGEEMYESADIVRYLFEHYGDGRIPALLRGPPAIASGSLASAVRGRRGLRASASRPPAEPLELYSFEASPFCRIAREELCALELPYLLHNVAKRSPSRDAFVERSGKMMVPYLADPNTGKEMFESADIVEYLRQTYAA